MNAERETRIAERATGEPRDDAWILTFTGRRMWPLDPRPADICIEDIAHALSLTCRFTGHCREFYSVAQHSVLVSLYVKEHGGDAALQLAALLHDASEAYLPDVARPVKQRFAITIAGAKCVYCEQQVVNSFSAAERRLMTAICSTFGVPLWNAEAKLVKQADIALLLAERRDLMPPEAHCWATALGAQDVPLWADTILPWATAHAESRFLAEFKRLCAEVKP